MTAPFPAVLSPNDVDLAALDVAEVKALLLDRGAVVLRGFRIDDGSIVTFAGKICDRLHTRGWYEGREGSRDGSPLFGVDRGNGWIGPHAENAFFPPARPDIGVLWVRTPCAQDGETTVVDGHAIFESLASRAQSAASSLMLDWNIVTGYEAFEVHYGVTTKQQFLDTMLPGLSASCEAKGITLSVGEITDDGVELAFREPVAFGSARGPAIATALAYPRVAHRPGIWCGTRGASWGPLADKMRAAARARLLAPKWQPNDVIVLDNWTTMHGRRAFPAGAARDIRTCWGEAAWVRPPRRSPGSRPTRERPSL